MIGSYVDHFADTLSDCYRSYVTLKIREEGNSYNITCPGYQCKTVIGQDIVKQLVDKPTYKMYSILLLKVRLDGQSPLMLTLRRITSIAIHTCNGVPESIVDLRASSSRSFYTTTMRSAHVAMHSVLNAISTYPAVVLLCYLTDL